MKASECKDCEECKRYNSNWLCLLLSNMNSSPKEPVYIYSVLRCPKECPKECQNFDVLDK